MENEILIEDTFNSKIFYPSLTERIKSSVTDILFIVFLMSIVAMLMDEVSDVPDWMRACIFVTLFFIYEPLTQTFGCTLGNYLMDIRIRNNAKPNQKINIFQAYIRFACKSLSGIYSFFTINSNSKRRSMHDMISGTVVVYAE
jgi:uncharacterized RDD family membrane protein YckC